MAKNKDLIAFRLESKDKEKLVALAASDGRPLSQFVRRIIESYLKQK